MSAATPSVQDAPAARSLRRWARVLGLGGLVPFAALALASLALPGDLARIAVHAQVQYGAAILSFVGALHWGVALAAPSMSARRTRLTLAWSVLPALYAAGAVVAPDLLPDVEANRTSLALLAVGFVAAWLVDRLMYRGHPVPDWFVRLRATLTVGATLALLWTLVLA